MPTFDFIGELTISIHTSVDADTLEEAQAIADERDLTRIKDEGDRTKVWRTSGELDGVPKAITYDPPDPLA